MADRRAQVEFMLCSVRRISLILTAARGPSAVAEIRKEKEQESFNRQQR